MTDRRWLSGVALWLVVGCGGSSSSTPDTGGSSSSGGAPNTGGTADVTTGGSRASGGRSPIGGGNTGGSVAPPSTGGLGTLGEDEAALRGELTAVGNYTESDLAEHYPASFQSGLGYEPRDSLWLERIQASSVALNDQELSALSNRGFTISERLRFPDYFYGYKTLYFEHLPLFVSTDSVLYALHRSYDSLLTRVEYIALEPKLQQLLRSLRSRLPFAGFPASTTHDLGLYLAVAEGLLVANAPDLTAEAQTLIASATAASGLQTLELFGSSRDEDFSQFKPRGHYTGLLANYFRAMMWLGREDFRFLETQPDGSQVLRRAAVEAAVALDELFTPEDRQTFATIDGITAAFVGESDYLTLSGLDSLLAGLGVTGVSGLGAFTDEALQAAIAKGNYGVQRIASHILVVGTGTSESPPNSLSFALLGQRYVLDSHVFSNVTYSRVPERAGIPLRMMPNPLDVAFAALGNNQAASLLTPELTQYAYAGQLAQMRLLADAHPDSYWSESLYTLWLGALRQLSPNLNETNLPAVARTEAWGRRILNTQLASWAELRHDTLLYAKQSYTAVPSCEYPDAYVDPYPEVFGRLARFAELGKSLLAPLSATGVNLADVNAYLDALGAASAHLQSMAEHQRAGTPHSDEDLAFINDAVRISSVSAGCTTIQKADGWYARLFFNPDDAKDTDPTIADVHTQPADEAGNIVGNVLHVGTGYPRLMVMTVDSCNGPRAYAGLVSSYFEKTTTNFERLTDEAWSQTVSGASPADVSWLEDLVER